MSVTSAARMARRRRRLTTYGWIVGLTAITVGLIYWEQTALLYILATVGVTILLVVVAMADLAHAESMTAQGTLPTPGETAGRR
jgi:hypothetical protein